jgi:hypothetical protein
MPEQQNYSNHARYFPLFHFVIFPLLAINFLCHLVRLFLEPSWERGFWTLLSVVFILMILAARIQALTVQNRVIRLEEKLRYKDVLSPDLAAKTETLSLGQIIALRFASDEELPNLVERTLNGEFAEPKDIKMAIKNWQGDHLRA